MRYALVNPDWTFHGSTYFGCQEPHYPLELLFAADQIRAAGNEPLLIDAQSDKLSFNEVKRRVDAFAADFLVIPTAPSYLFWRCPPPELRVPAEWFAALGGAAVKVVIGPHGSATAAATFRKTNCDVVLRGEPDFAIAELASKPWESIAGCCYLVDGKPRISPELAVADMKQLGALDFKNYNVEGHQHRHHVFSGSGRGAELEFARGCPWSCTFCNKTLFRNKFRERDVDAVPGSTCGMRSRSTYSARRTPFRWNAGSRASRTKAATSSIRIAECLLSASRSCWSRPANGYPGCRRT